MKTKPMAEADGWTLREFGSGDLGLICGRQAAIYAEEWGWGQPLEALIYEIAGTFLRGFKPGREQCWVAERGGQILGGVFLCEEDDSTARLRLLYVEPDTRGMGIGRALVHQCTLFAREAGYERIVLWTHGVLDAARKLYAAEGYVVTSTEVQTQFGKEETSEHWLLEL